MDGAFRIAILGDDFTPSALFEDALRQALDFWPGELVFITADMTPDDLVPYVSDEVHEAFGSPAEAARLAEGAHLLVTTFAPVTAEMLDRVPGLIAVVCGRGGPANVNVAAASRRGIPVLNAPGRNAQAVAEFTLAGMINLMRRIPATIDYVRGGAWDTAREDTFEKPSGPELAGKTVGLLGFGHIGRLVARLVAAFGARPLICDPEVEEGAIAGEGYEKVDLERLLAEADVISLHARLPEGAPPILGEAEFARMKRRPFLINTARAAALDHDALLRALEAGSLSGALLDVYPEEPLARDGPLFRAISDRLLLTPHAAGLSWDIPGLTARIVAEGVASLLKGDPPRHVVNPDALATCLERLQALRGR